MGILIIIAGFLLLLAGILLSRYFLYGVKANPKPFQTAFQGPEKACDHLAEALTFRTISYDNPQDWDIQSFIDFQEWLRSTYPLVHDNLELEKVNGHALLYHWKGEVNTEPIVLLAHYDVVPANPEDEWRYGPFSGKVAEGCIWGRGALDDKVSLIGILEAVEKLLQDGFQPSRPVYLAFGYDEEVGGQSGAANLAQSLVSKGEKPAFILDEGLAVTDGIVPGSKVPMALIGTAEKGNMNVELKASAKAGHSSMPERKTAAGSLAKIIKKVTNKPFPARFTQPVKAFFRVLAPHSNFFQRLALANQWLFRSVIIWNFSRSGSGNATIRTTLAPTILNAGEKVNTLPKEAKGLLNIRLLPGDNKSTVMNRLNKVIKSEEAEIKSLGEANLPTSVAETDHEGFKTLQATIRTIFPDAVAAPTIVLGATDSRHYEKLTKQIFRFSPIRLDQTLMETIHSKNERISQKGFNQVVSFYGTFLKNATTKH